MRVVFVGFDLGVAGGNRAIFEIANRLRDRGYDASIVALGGDHGWYNVRVPVKYVEINDIVKRKSVSKLVSGLITMYKFLSTRSISKPGLFDFYAMLKKLGIHIYLDRTMHLTENLPDADVYIATWYPTALSIWLGSRGSSRRLFLCRTSPSLLRRLMANMGLSYLSLY